MIKPSEQAKQEVAEALTRAENIRNRSVKIAEGWAQSRTDNNFRLMLRKLAKGSTHDSA